MLSSDIVRQHNLDLESETSLREDDVLDGLVDVVVLGLTGRDQVPSFVLLDFGSLLSEFSGDDYLASLDLFDLHDVLDDEHSGGSDGGLLHDFGLEKFALSIGGQGLVDDDVELEDNVSSGELVSLGHELFVLVGLLTLCADGRLSVDDLNDDGKILRGLFDDQSGVTGSDQSSGEELVDFGLEDSVGDKSSLLGQFNVVHRL